MSAHLYRTIQNKSTGKLLQGAQVSLCAPGTDTLIGTPIFSDNARQKPLSNPFTAVSGIIDLYLAQGQTVRLKVTYGTETDVIENLSIYPRVEDLQPNKFPPSDAVVLGWFLNETFQYASITRDSSGTMTSASIIWPDGLIGSYIADTVSVTAPGRADAWHATRISDTSTQTFSQPLVSRDPQGRIVAKPQVVLS